MSKTAVFGLFVLILLPKVFRRPAKGLAGRPARHATLRTSPRLRCAVPRRGGRAGNPSGGSAERSVRGAGCLRNEPNPRPARVSCIWGPLEHQLVPDSDCSSPAAPSFRLRGPLTILGSRCFNISLPAPAPTARRTAGALPAISLPPSPQARGPRGLQGLSRRSLARGRSRVQVTSYPCVLFTSLPPFPALPSCKLSCINYSPFLIAPLPCLNQTTARPWLSLSFPSFVLRVSL
ncbi:uncharacterized protein LOC118603831 [Rousettus aegyptiacus]|uniref:uncharacterized protein LOC118603831 n=1 Tax=Rousettus aegyptiacus TaxID=9407 RepID=UPI00168CD105|nr:uncharacterized protein LOC118603831 [Rousettus aegyptiacus]